MDLFTLADARQDLVHQETLEKYCRRAVAVYLNPKLAKLRALPTLATSRPLTLPYFHSAELAAHIERAAAERSYDRIFISCSAMAQYADGLTGIPALIDIVDVDSDKWTQYASRTSFPFSAIYRREGRCLEEYERRICERFSQVIVTTDREAELVRRFSPNAPVRVIPNGVDTVYFQAPEQVAGTDPTIIFTGDMSYFPNEDAVVFFATEVLPLVRRSVPNVRFLIVGRNPTGKVQGLGSLAGVEVTGFVPDVRTYLAQSHVAVAPFSIAAGIQNKILEAMAFGRPVVATPRATQGLSARVRDLVETADGAEELSKKVIRLLTDGEFARDLGERGRRQVTADYDWGRTLGELLQLVENPTLQGDLTSHVP